MHQPAAEFVSTEEFLASTNPSRAERHSGFVMRQGDSPDYEQLLRAHDRSVRALAVALVGAGPDADDVVQETWLLAMRRPPRHGRDLRGWLATIVRNVVRQGHRSRVRRNQHEGIAPTPPGVEAPADLVERADLQRRMVENVLALPEPLRATLLLRYFDGLGPRAIAQRHEVPLETVRTRLRRGLQRLRDELTRATGGKRSAWLPVAALIAGHPATVPTLSTIVMMSTKAKLCVAAAAVLLAWFAIDSFAGDQDAPPVEAASRTAAATGATSDVADPSQAPQQSASRTQSRVVAAEAVVVPGIVMGLRANVPFTSRVEFVATSKGGDAPARSTRLSASVAADGSFRFEVPRWVVRPQDANEQRVFVLSVDDPRYLPVERELRAAELQRATSHPLKLELSAAAVLRGEVQQVGDVPAANVLVTAHANGANGPATDPLVRVRTDADGVYRLRLAEAVSVSVLAYLTDEGAADDSPHGDADPRWQPGTAQADAVPGAVTDVLPIQLEQACEVQGKVVWPDGTPIAGARVSAFVRGSVGWLQPERTAFGWLRERRAVRASASDRTDAEGRFTLRGLSAVPCDVGMQWIGGDPVVVAGIGRVVTPPAATELTLDAVQLRLTVTDGANPLSDAKVRVRKGNRIFGAGVEQGRRRVVLGRDDAFLLVAEAPGYVTREVEWQAPAGATELDLEIALQPHPAHDVQVVLDAAWQHAHFVLQPVDREGVDKQLDFELARTDGKFVLPDVPAGRYRLTVGRPHKREHDNWLVPHTRELDVPTAGTVRLPEVAAGGRIVVRCTSHDGRFLGGACHVQDAGGEAVTMPFQVIKTGSKWFGGHGHLLPAGPNESARNLAPGEYLVRVAPEGKEAREQWVTVVAQQDALVEFVY